VQISNKLKGGYRFGFNGQEKVDEIAGAGNHTTAEFWEYDTRLGRRWNRDPVVKPWESSYACFANNPIWYSDVNGDDGTQTGSGNGYMTGDLNNVVVRSSKLDPDKKEDDGEKSSGGGGGGAAAGGGPNSKNSVGADQLKKYSPLLQAQGFGIADNGGGNGGDALGGGGAYGPDSKRENEIEWLETTSKANGIVGLAATGFEHLTNKANLVKFGKNLGHGTLTLGTGVDAIGVYNFYTKGANDPNAVHPRKLTLNLGVGLWGLMNPATAAGSAVYFGIDAFYPGGFPAAMNKHAEIINRDKKLLGYYPKD
jgi:hypothetical protein